ncbi:kielin/chordin-like protein isoform X2 [Leptidea sinapis]|uniref:Pacifastin domain-containing protein n=1 Tax=Leptidea sinapis TaxID=189913 RepID=A0A5E4QXL4_9NEOP|nr:kielin/chordin-like protein isoform X2 [Leptidea sinapis]VVD02418.1 unnamed protein product [Leptidea sinapis]
MKWLLLSIIVCLAGRSTAGVLKCAADTKDASCMAESIEKEPIKSSPVSKNEVVRLELAECAPGSEWESNCHRCRCDEMGRAQCTRMETCEKGTYDDPIKCKPNTKFNRDCNTCICLESGLGLCTLKACPTITRNKSKLLPGRECLPGTSWTNRCNKCVCSQEGYANCSKNECPGQENEAEVQCAAESTWLNDCNTCWCSDGRVMCTKIGCSFSVIDTHPKLQSRLSLEQKSEKTGQNKTKSIVCPANRMFIKDCNTCWCNEDGTSFYCTRKVCLPDGSEPPEDKPESLRIHEGQCRPDEVFELDCNMCRCNPDGKSFSCTRRACVVEAVVDDIKNTAMIRRTRATQQGAPKACKPGQEFRIDCNKCLCDNEGQNFSCTRIDCVAQNSGNGGVRRKRDTTEQVKMDCGPGTVFEIGCNVCRCSAEGSHATCTMKRCKQEIIKNDVNTSESDVGFRCNAGEQFKRDCNDCTCSADGKSVFCTLRLCDVDINPTI